MVTISPVPEKILNGGAKINVYQLSLNHFSNSSKVLEQTLDVGNLASDNPMNDSYSNLKVLMIEQDMTAGGAVPVLPWSSSCQCPFHEGSRAFSVAFWSQPLSHGGRYHLGLQSTWGSSTFTGVPSPTFPTGFLHFALYLSTSFTWKAEISSVREHRM